MKVTGINTKLSTIDVIRTGAAQKLVKVSPDVIVRAAQILEAGAEGSFSSRADLEAHIASTLNAASTKVLTEREVTVFAGAHTFCDYYQYNQVGTLVKTDLLGGSGGLNVSIDGFTFAAQDVVVGRFDLISSELYDLIDKAESLHLSLNATIICHAEDAPGRTFIYRIIDNDLIELSAVAMEFSDGSKLVF